MKKSFTADFAFLDSGTGGIPYMLSLKEKQPQAICVYLGDTEHFPYGEKTTQQITECAAEAIKLIIDRWNPKTIIIACNTISVTALEQLRKRFPQVPLVGTVPAIKLASKVSKNRKIGLLATNASVNSPYSQKLIDDFASDCEVYRRGDPDLIHFIEKKLFNATEDEKLAAVMPAVSFFKNKGCDTIILGCTHFTHIAEVMQKAAGKDINVIDSREGVSNQAIRVEHSDCYSSIIMAEQNGEGFEDNSFFVTKASTEEQLEYKKMCSLLNIPWGGIINL